MNSREPRGGDKADATAKKKKTKNKKEKKRKPCVENFVTLN
jgi:hypothetical protein